jgi:SecD/SecF fusion protein
MNLPGSSEGERYSLERRVAMEGQHTSDVQLVFIP